MPMKKFSIESLEYFAEKFSNTPSLSDESLIYLNSQITQLIFKLLQDAHKFQRKCHRIHLTADDFSFALKLHQIDPIYGTYSIPTSFRKLKKDNRIIYQIDDQIFSLNDVIHSRIQVPVDISIRTHWLAIDGEQPSIPENPIIDRPIRTILKKKLNRHSHLLSIEQQIYFKELTEMCICSNEHYRRQALLILSTDSSLVQILSRLLIFISEGIRINLLTCSRILKYLLQMIEALLKNANLLFESYLHFLYPSILSCLLNHKKFDDHWSIRELAAKCSGQILRKSNAYLQQRTIKIFSRIFNSNDYTLVTQYGALIGLCEINHQVIIRIVFPLIKQLGETIRKIQDQELIDKFTQIILKYVLVVYRSNEYECEKNLYEDFGPLIHQQLILLL